MRLRIFFLLLLFISCKAQNGIEPMTQSDLMEQSDPIGQPGTVKIPDAIQPADTMKNTIPFTYLALGDSYTIGESVSENERYPVQFADSVRLLKYKIENPLIIAKTGWTTDELNKGIEAVSPQGKYDLVTLLIGVNNQYRGRDTAEYRTQFAQLLKRSINFAVLGNKGVIVISIPDWGVTPFAKDREPELIAKEIDTFNKINKEESEKESVYYFDITGISRQAVTSPDLIARDGLHPSGKMYELWMKLFFDRAFSILKEGLK
ncbi:MAG: SGNH/GDSL hydrolase family protein [Melioribacteraceae bacterium]|nr:SGNH/GDSL hydrolase family protein [Melioribacteraceae bacterium]